MTTEVAIGTRDDAIRALKGYLPYIGEGSFRKVYINDDRTVVYKVCNLEDNCASDCNRDERDCYQEMADRGYKCMAPTYSWVCGNHVVNAQPYYNGPRNQQLADELMYMLQGYVYDIAYYNGGNIAFDNNGMPIVVDLQFFDPEGHDRMIKRQVA